MGEDGVVEEETRRGQRGIQAIWRCRDKDQVEGQEEIKETKNAKNAEG